MKQWLTLILSLCLCQINAQEYTAPLRDNVLLRSGEAPSNLAQKPSLLGLPFFEDFVHGGVYPDAEKWSDHYVYITNTMARAPISAGAATFDGLNEVGVPYDSLIAFSLVSADSLTSQAIDLSTYAPSDSLYLSFFYQARGNGFAPKPADSFLLFLQQSNGVWRQVWKTQGDTSTQWHQVMIPVNDTGYFHEQFKMRWVNKATMGVGNSHWHLDYIRLDANRHYLDTSLQDLAMSNVQSSMLNDFSAMPYRHFKTNPQQFMAGTLAAVIHNNSSTSQNLDLHLQANLLPDGTVLHTDNTNGSIAPYTLSSFSLPAYALPDMPATSNFSIAHTFHFSSSTPDARPDNDTIRQVQVFDNYFAYDDGTAEQSYFLNLLPSAPGRTAVEYAFYVQDTLQGLAMQFARQVPSGSIKEFSIAIYQDIAVNGGQEELIYREDFLLPRYADTANGFVTYAFETPQVLPAGNFFIVLIQPAGGISDSLYMALDVNREENNHRYFDVGEGWIPSQIQGALLWRPLAGPPLPPSAIETQEEVLDVRLYPNPATTELRLQATTPLSTGAWYTIYDLEGKEVRHGLVRNNAPIDIRQLAAGIYVFQLGDGGKQFIQKFVKQ